MVRKFVTVSGLVAILLSVLPGCGSGQDAGQPAVGSISAEDRADDKGLMEKKPGSPPKAK